VRSRSPENRPGSWVDAMIDSLKPPYTFDKLRAATKKAVIDEVTRQLGEFENQKTSGADKAVFALSAQFLMQELARRDQNRQAYIMIVCTILIAIMTLAITVMTGFQVSQSVGNILIP
jgi:hypothetical protein